MKKLLRKKLKVTDLEILMNYVASGVEPRGIKLGMIFTKNIKKSQKRDR